MTVSINASPDGTYGELRVNGNPSFRFGADNSGQLNDFRNRIINGAMAIDQRNLGAAVTPSVLNSYIVDRWSYGSAQASKMQLGQNLGAVALPADIVNYLGIKTVVAYVPVGAENFTIAQPIEGFNFADAKFGTSDAQPITLSFRIHTNVVGTHSGSFRNAAVNRSYPFTFSVPVADTWTTINITIPGDTTGTWVGSTNAVGIYATFNLGSGPTASGPAGAWTAGNFSAATGAVSVVSTLNATFNIAKVQLEVGSIASAFERRSYGVEFGLCRRYFQKFVHCIAQAISTTSGTGVIFFDVPMRTTPTLSGVTASSSTAVGGTVACTIAITGGTFENSLRVDFSGATGLVAGNATYIVGNGANLLNAEL